ncbi:MAG: OmpH family outer membrane protein [Planctomycetaceae bacterium]|nr:OmpH family outer membrane protein [Planctomycetaceae bacterium]
MLSKVYCGMVIGVVVIACAAGCDKNAGPAKQPGTVAVIDLDKIANGIGVLQRINEATSTDSANAQQQLVGLQNRLQAELNQAVTKAGATPTDEQKRNLEQMRINGMGMLERARRQLSEEVARRRATALNDFRQQVAPIAKNIAKEKGFDLVVIKADVILAMDDEVDISEPVLQEVNTLTKAGRFRTFVPQPPVTTAPAAPPAPAAGTR